MKSEARNNHLGGVDESETVSRHGLPSAHVGSLPALPFGRCLLLICLFVLLVLPTKKVSAQELIVENLRQEDLNGDGQPDLTILQVNLQTPFDEVRIYDGAGNMAQGNDWQSTTDFEDDTWVFDTLADGNAQLVLKFFRVGETITAQLFIDQSGDSIVNLEVDGTNIHVLESPYPSMTVTVQGDWFLPDGQLNWNVLFETDGPVVHLHTYNLTDAWNRGGFMKLDGKPDIEVEFRDEESDGIAEYGWWRLLTPTPASWGSVRTWLWGNEANHRPQQPTDFVFWPYLISENYDSPLEGGRAVSSGRNYFDVPPGISFAFGAGQIRSFFFPGYPIEHGFHVNTLEYFEDFEVNYTNFENMQAYYDLANDNDNAPELHIRHRYYAAGDDYGWNLKSPVNGIRWSWNQMNEPDIVWDYRLGLAGRHVLTTEMELPDFSFTTIPYDELPTWVTSQQWDYGTFVSSEKQPLYSTEGIYTWGAVETAAEGEPSTLSRYLAGEVAVDLGQAFESIAFGWRGELAPELKGQPYLYFSPIDHKLHLVKATYGIWNIDNQFAIRYADRDGDNYLDQWQVLELPPDMAADEVPVVEPTKSPFETEEPVETAPQAAAVVLQELTLASGYFLYVDRFDGQVLIKEANPPQSSFEVLPPRNHEEYSMLTEQLKANQHELAPDDLQGMMAQFDGPVSQIEQATLRDIRSQAEGFRFILELQAGASTSGENLLNLATLEPGEVLVIFENGAFRIEELRPAKIELDVNVPENDLLGETDPRLIRLKASNTGLEDAKGLTLVVEAKDSQGQTLVVAASEAEAEEVAPQTIDLLSGEPEFVTLTWQPPAPGRWELHFSLYDSGIEENTASSQIIVAEKSHVITVPFDANPNEEQSLMALLTSAKEQPFSVPALLAFPASMILALFLVSRRKERVS